LAVKDGPFDKGDWIVHTYYGVGQIKSIEKKALGDDQAHYYKVESRNSTFFVPVTNEDNNRVRPVATRYRLRKVAKLLRQKPVLFDEKHTVRKREISDRMADGSMEATAELVRDLEARRKQFGLNEYDGKVLEDMTSRLAREWSITEDIEMDDAIEKVDSYIGEALKKVPAKQ
jgi:RNA polymerase-interacting CarD/CdnL/TRCF family regulator